MPSEALLNAAQHVMDAYLQNFASEDEFFKLEDFAYWVGVSYDEDIANIAEQLYLLSRSDSGDGQITFSDGFIQYKDYTVQKEDGRPIIKLDVDTPVFRYDTQNSVIQDIFSIGKGNCGGLIRTTLSERWQLSSITKTNMVWWLMMGKEVEFINNNGVFPSKVRVAYIPSSKDPNFKIPTGREKAIAIQAYNMMQEAKNGNPIVDMTNDGNPNVSPQTELNIATSKPVR